MSPKRCLTQMLWASLLLICTELHADWREALPASRLVGAGEMSVFGFKVYRAQLWSPTPVVDELLSYRQPFALVLTYSRSISAGDLIDASVREISRINGSPVSAEQLSAWQKEMQQAFVDVDEGDRITGVFLPGLGVRFYVGQTLQHYIPDEAFARAFFSIWLDPRTRNPELRSQLIGASRP